MKIMGIDLAGRVDNPTGICVLNAYNVDGEAVASEDKIKINKINFNTIYTDEELMKQINDLEPSLIVIDAPLSLPKGRCCLEKDCECSVGGHFRQCEREIRRYGPVLPLTFRGMKMLTMRGVALASSLSGKYQLKETHPRTAQKILGFENLEKDLETHFHLNIDTNEHELDAIIAALTGFFYLNSCYLELGDADEGTIILPESNKCLKILN